VRRGAMKLTDKELEIMAVLWDSKKPLTANEIIEASDNRTWKESSIYIIMNTLVKKKAVILKYYKPTGSNTARAYEPIISSEQYTVSAIRSMRKNGIRIDIPTLIEFLEAEEG
jgi:predicted transcriptional regulator